MTSKLNCHILDDYQQVSMNIANWDSLLPHLNITVHPEHHPEDTLIEQLKDAHIVVAMRERTPFTARLIQHLPHLKLLVTSGMRNASIDLTAARAQGVTVCGTRSTSHAPAELTWALLLGLARNIHTENHNLTHHGPWQSTIGTGLHGKTLGLLGLGKIGSQVAHIGQAFGMHTIAWSQNLTPEKARSLGVECMPDKSALLQKADFVSIHLVLSERTRHLLQTRDLQQMKPTACLINTSRASIIEPEGLLKALKENWIAGAGLDVFEEEPLPREHPLRTLPNVLATPHLGYVTRENYQIYFQEAVEDIHAYLNGNPIRLLE